MDDGKLFPDHIKTTNDILVINFGEEYIYRILSLINNIRNNRSVSIYPDSVKLSKQFTYADKNKFNYVLIFGDQEMNDKSIKIKNLKTGEEIKYNLKVPVKDYKF